MSFRSVFTDRVYILCFDFKEYLQKSQITMGQIHLKSGFGRSDLETIGSEKNIGHDHALRLNTAHTICDFVIRICMDRLYHAAAHFNTSPYRTPLLCSKQSYYTPKILL